MAFLHTMWKQWDVILREGMPLEEGGVHGGLLLASLTFRSEAAITGIRSRYGINFYGTLYQNLDGSQSYGGAWWEDISPVFRVDYNDGFPADYPNPWMEGDPITSVASGSLDFMGLVETSQVVPNPNLVTAWWRTSGNTEGMRKVPGGDNPLFATMTFGQYPSSAAANLPGPTPRIDWTWNGFLRTLVGSSSSLF